MYAPSPKVQPRAAQPITNVLAFLMISPGQQAVCQLKRPGNSRFRPRYIFVAVLLRSTAVTGIVLCVSSAGTYEGPGDGADQRAPPPSCRMEAWHLAVVLPQGYWL